MSQILTPDQIKVEECKVEIQKVLEKYGCIFEPFITIISGQMQQGINVVAKPQLTAEQEQAMREAMMHPTEWR